MSSLIPPHGGVLKDLQASPERARELRERLVGMPSWDLADRQSCDLEMLLDGSFSPLEGFLGRDDYESVRDAMRLRDGTLWPMPVTLDVSADFARDLRPGDEVALRNPEGGPVAILTVRDAWVPDKAEEARRVFGTEDTAHPAVHYLFHRAGDTYLGGTVEGLERVHHYTFQTDRHAPAELRREFEKRGWDRVVAFQTRNPLHRAHFEMTLRAAREHEANFLLNPVVGMTKPGDVSAYSRVRCYRAVMPRYPPESSKLSLLPLAMRMGGPREALWHGIIRKNLGCTHFVVGRDHAGPGNDSNGRPFYGPYDAQELFREHQEELGIEMVDFRFMSYVPERGEYLAADEVPAGMETADLSGTELRRRLRGGLDIPDWFSFPEVIEELRREFPPRDARGFTVFFTGLSGSGKSTIANALMAKLMELGTRPVTLLDGDIVRKNLSSELGFSKEHRDLNIRRIGFVAGEITKNRGVALCAPIAPYDATRKAVRADVEAVGGFVLVHVATPLEVCEARDRKGLYAKARQGVIKEFTGISDPYEVPDDADVVIDTSRLNPEEAAHHVYRHLQAEGYVA